MATSEAFIQAHTEYTHASSLVGVHEDWAVAARKKGWARSKSPEALAKLAEAMRGKPMLKHMAEILRHANVGRRATAETRRKMREAHLRRGSLPPNVRPWTKGEDALVRRLPAAEVARRTKRSICGVYQRRWRLGIPDGRRRGSGRTGRWA